MDPPPTPPAGIGAPASAVIVEGAFWWLPAPTGWNPPRSPPPSPPSPFAVTSANISAVPSVTASSVVFRVGGEAMARVDGDGAWEHLLGLREKRRVMEKHAEEKKDLQKKNGELQTKLKIAKRRVGAA